MELMKINEDKLEEVGDLVDVDSNNLTKNGFRKKINLVYYYLIQFAFFVFSSLVGVAFGLYSRSIDTYPFAGFTQRYLYGSIILAITHSVNLGLSFQLSRKKQLILNKKTPKELSPIYIYPVILLNIILSSISLFTMHNLVHTGNIFSLMVAYGVFDNKKIIHK